MSIAKIRRSALRGALHRHTFNQNIFIFHIAVQTIVVSFRQPRTAVRDWMVWCLQVYSFPRNIVFNFSAFFEKFGFYLIFFINRLRLGVVLDRIVDVDIYIRTLISLYAPLSFCKRWPTYRAIKCWLARLAKWRWRGMLSGYVEWVDLVVGWPPRLTGNVDVVSKFRYTIIKKSLNLSSQGIHST